MSGDLDAILELGDFPWSAPTAPGDPYFGNVRSLIHFNDAPGTSVPVDTIGFYTWSASANDSVVNSTSKFGSGSIYHNAGSCGGLSTNTGETLGNIYTFEFFVKWDTWYSPFADQSGVFSVYYTVSPASTQLSVSADGTHHIRLISESQGTITSDVVANLGQWYFIAICADGANTYFFVDGVLKGTLANVVNFAATSNIISLGSCTSAFAYSKNYKDEFRFTRGICRYTGNFTPPTSEFPNSQYLPATPGGGVIFPISGSLMKSIGTSSGVITPADVSLTFNPNGTVQWVDYSNTYPDLPANVNGLTNTFNWIYPNQIDTGDVTAPGASYWIRCVPISGGVPGPTSWTPLTSQVRFTLDNLFAKEVVEAFNIQIASDSNGNNIVCNSTEWTFSSFTVGGMYAGIVNPLVGGTYTTGSLHSARISLSIYKDGTGSVIVTRDESYPQYIYTSLYPFNWYTPNSSNIGSSYWVKITPITGSLSYNNATTVVSLYNGVTCGVLNVSTGGTIASCQFKVEIFFDIGGTILVSSGFFTFNALVV